MKKIIIILLMIISLLGCVTYNPNYMESKTTRERITDVTIITIFGSIIGASIAINIIENNP